MKKYENVAHPNVYFWLKALCLRNLKGAFQRNRDRLSSYFQKWNHRLCFVAAGIVEPTSNHPRGHQKLKIQQLGIGKSQWANGLKTSSRWTGEFWSVSAMNIHLTRWLLQTAFHGSGLSYWELHRSLIEVIPHVCGVPRSLRTREGIQCQCQTSFRHVNSRQLQRPDAKCQTTANVQPSII